MTMIVIMLSVNSQPPLRPASRAAAPAPEGGTRLDCVRLSSTILQYK